MNTGRDIPIRPGRRHPAVVLHRKLPGVKAPAKLVFSLVVLAGLLLCSQAASADAGGSGVSITLTAPGQDGQLSVALKIILLLTVLAFAPAILVCVTSFTRIVVVLAFARQALGTQNTPPNQVIVGIALFLTLFTMSPTIAKIHESAVAPYLNDELAEAEAFDRGVDALKRFMLRHTREADLGMFYEVAAENRPDHALAVPLRILIPAFVLSELKTAFEMGFLIFVPFLLIDLVVAAVLMAMGMMMLPPVLIAMPFKILLFVMVDGWHLLVGSIAQSFA